jgi:asparagine N-glycosylation enzyme membrane subunit Stt3
MRIVLPWQNIMMGETIRFNTVDAYYFVHLAELYPNIPQKDLMIGYPDGLNIFAPLWSQLIGFIGNVDFTAAILPAILGILTVIPVYFISKAILPQKLAVITTLVYSIFGGDLLIRTQLGAADHHALELFAFMYTMMFVVLFIQSKKWYWLLSAMPFFILYCLAWAGWYLIPIMLLAYLYCRYLSSLKKYEFIGGVFATILVIGIILISDKWLDKLSILFWDINATTAEEQPLFFSNGQFNSSIAWAQFGISFYLALLGLGAFAYKYFKERKTVDLFFLVWTLSVLALTLAQQRFAMYLSLNVIILALYFCVILLKAIPKQKMIATAVLVLLVIYPMINASVQQVTDKRNLMSVGWQETTQWLNIGRLLTWEDGKLKDVDGESFIKSWDKYKDGKSDFGVLSWWDYGYWIIQQGKCGAYATPGSDGHREIVAQLLLDTTEDELIRVMQEKNLRYLVIDSLMVTQKFKSIVSVAGYNEANYLPIGYQDTMLFKLYYGNPDRFKNVYNSKSQSKIDGL